MIAAHGRGRQKPSQPSCAPVNSPHSADMQARFSSNYGLWAGSYLHGDLPAIFEPAQAFLRRRDAARFARGGRGASDYGVAMVCRLVEARTHLKQAAAIFDPGDRDLAFRFGQDVGVSAMVYLAMVLALGEVDRARRDR